MFRVSKARFKSSATATALWCCCFELKPIMISSVIVVIAVILDLPFLKSCCSSGRLVASRTSGKIIQQVEPKEMICSPVGNSQEVEFLVRLGKCDFFTCLPHCRDFSVSMNWFMSLATKQYATFRKCFR